MTDQLSGGVVQPTDAQILPKLPGPAVHAWADISEHFLREHHYTAEQMRAYALQALAVPQAPLQAEPVPVVASEQVIQDFAAWAAPHLDGSYIRHWVTRFRNALATPQAEPAAAEQARVDAVTRAIDAFDERERGMPQAHIAAKLVKEMRAALASQSTPPPAQNLELQGVAETLKEGGGFWRTCSGCHESNEGHATGPYSDLMCCTLGGGCSECGGIGATWDTTDYNAMADDMTSTPPPESAGQGLSDAQRLDWLAPEHTSRFVEREKGMFRVYEDVAMPEAPHHHWQACTSKWWPTAQQAIDGAILAANPTAQPDGGSKA